MRYKLALLEDDHVGPRHNISVGGPANVGFDNLEVSDEDEAAVLLPAIPVEELRAHLHVSCVDCNVVLREDEDYALEEVEPWKLGKPMLKLVK